MIIVTGGEGFIGKHLCAALRARGEYVLSLDRLTGNDVNDCALPAFPDRVFHLAAQTNAYSKDAEQDAHDNIMGALRIFDAYRDRVVFASSAMVNYPVNPYAISKRAGEDYARLYGCAIVRLPNVYGPGGHSFIEKCKTLPEITIYGSGTQLRSWTHVDNAVLALLAAKPGSCTIVPGVTRSVKQIAAEYGKPIRYEPAREGDVLTVLQLDTEN